MPLDYVEITITDLEDVRWVLDAAYSYFYAHDLQAAQLALTGVRPSPLTSDLERVKARFDGYMADFLLAAHEAELEQDDAEDEDAELGAEDGSEELAEGLSTAPLGGFTRPRQRGRRLTPEELAQPDE